MVSRVPVAIQAINSADPLLIEDSKYNHNLPYPCCHLFASGPKELWPQPQAACRTGPRSERERETEEVDRLFLCKQATYYQGGPVLDMVKGFIPSFPDQVCLLNFHIGWWRLHLDRAGLAAPYILLFVNVIVAEAFNVYILGPGV